MSFPITPPPEATTFSLPLTSQRNAPRFNEYEKLLHGFCEVLFLLKGLGPIRGLHTPVPPARNEAHERQRAFFRNLALVCDSQKGGSTVTAIGLVKKDDSLCIYAAANNPGSTIEFLQTSLQCLSRFMAADKPEKRELRREFIELCIRHSMPRIQTYLSSLRNCLDACIEGIVANEDSHYVQLVPWLRSIQTNCRRGVDSLTTCIAMFRATQQGHWNQLCTLADSTWDKESHFPTAKHNIGRLSNRIRAPRDMLVILQRFPEEFEALYTQIEVFEVPPMPAADWPAPDRHTSVDGILRSMVRATYPHRAEATKRLLYLEHLYSRELLQAVPFHYEESNPFVHAEIRVLEHLSSINADFFDDDRYIYTSKPACYCCRLYFQEHPWKMVVPESHFKIPNHWGFPNVEWYHEGDPASMAQRDLVNKMTPVMRKAILLQIDDVNLPSPHWHTDSTTGVPTISSLDTLSVFSDGMLPRLELGTAGISIIPREESDDDQLTPRSLTPEPDDGGNWSPRQFA